MKNLPSFDEYSIEAIFESIFSNDDIILEYEEKDMKRIKDMLAKSKGDLTVMQKYAERMANSIDDARKATRRGEAAEFFFGKSGERTSNVISDIFYSRAKQLGIDPESLVKQSEVARTANPKLNFAGGKGGAIFLPTFSAMALWKGEITGQLSDGAWENSRPYDHWKFWSELEVKHGRPEVQYSGMWPMKNAYNLSSLIQYVGDRMISVGKMARAAGTELTEDQINAAEYMPKDFEQWKLSSEDGAWQYDFVYKYMKSIPESLAKKYYSTTYTEKDLKSDLQLIKMAMATTRV